MQITWSMIFNCQGKCLLLFVFYIFKNLRYGTNPQGTIPEGTIPEGTIPEGLSVGTIPEGTIPEGIIIISTGLRISDIWSRGNTQIFNITDTKATFINYTSCGIYSTTLVPHSSTTLRGRRYHMCWGDTITVNSFIQSNRTVIRPSYSDNFFSEITRPN